MRKRKHDIDDQSGGYLINKTYSTSLESSSRINIKRIKTSDINEAFDKLHVKFPFGNRKVNIMFLHQLFCEIGESPSYSNKVSEKCFSGIWRILIVQSLGREEDSKIVVQVKEWEEYTKSKCKDSRNMEILELFFKGIKNYTNSFITESKLAKLMEFSEFKLPDIIRVLSKLGVLQSHLNANSFTISFPDIGAFVQSVKAARKRALKLFSGYPFNECLFSELIKRKGGQFLDWNFVVNDLHGIEIISKEVTTSNDVILRLLK